MSKLCVSEHENCEKKGTLEIFWPILGFYTKRVHKICDPCTLWNSFETNIMIDCKKETLIKYLW